MDVIVVLKFCKQEEIIPVVLPLVNEELEELFQLSPSVHLLGDDMPWWPLV